MSVLYDGFNVTTTGLSQGAVNGPSLFTSPYTFDYPSKGKIRAHRANRTKIQPARFNFQLKVVLSVLLIKTSFN
jgi:hypothetical protein